MLEQLTNQKTLNIDIDLRAQAHSSDFQNLKPEPKALSSHALGPGSAGLSRAGLGWLSASTPCLHITTDNVSMMFDCIWRNIDSRCEV